MKCTFTIVLFLLALIGNAQQTIIFPHQYEDALRGEQEMEDLVFYTYPYLSSSVDVRDIKSKYPQLKIEDYINIVPPNFTNVNTINVLMGVLSPEREPLLLIWLVGDYGRQTVTFFIDETLDRNFTNDRLPVRLLAGSDPVPMNIYPNGKDALPVKIKMAVPTLKLSRGDKQILFRGRRAKMNHNFAVGFHAGVGAGKLEYRFNNFETRFPAWYDVSILEKQLGINIAYYLPKFKINVFTQYQNVNQYTSAYNVRTDEPMVIIENGVRIKRENVTTINNRDIHSKHRYKVGADLAYRIHAGRFMDIQPTIEAGLMLYGNKEYIADKFQEPDRVFGHASDQFIGASINFEFATGMQKSFNLDINFTKIMWDPDNFFSTFNGDQLEKSYNIWGAHLGYNMKF